LCQRGKQAKAAQEQEHAGLEHRGGRHGLVWVALDEGVEMLGALVLLGLSRLGRLARAPGLPSPPPCRCCSSDGSGGG